MACNMRTNKRGFTIVELMIASVVFATVSLLTVTVVIGISRQYQKATYATQLNDAKRSIHQDLRNAIAYQNDTSVPQEVPPAGSRDYRLCVGSIVYSWKQHSDSATNLTADDYGLYKKTKTKDCLAEDRTSGTNLLPKNGFVNEFSMTKNGDNSYTITTNFAVGTADMFADTPIKFTQCLPTQKGGDFCSTMNYTSIVTSRI